MFWKKINLETIAATALIAFAPVLALAQGSAAKGDDERKLIAVLKSDAGLFEKAKACQKLAVVGGKEAVAPLAELLGDEKLAHYARFGLEPNPDPSVDAALRGAVGKLQGNLRVGAINSLGMRRDEGSLAFLEGLLSDPDAGSVAAATASLGRIGTPEAAAVLRRILEGAPEGRRAAIAEAAIDCAETMRSRGRGDEAAALCDFLRRAELPRNLRLAALQGSVLARQSASVALLVESLRSSEPAQFALALGVIRKMGGGAATRALLEELPRLSPERKAQAIQALGDLGDASILPSVVDAAGSGPAEARIAAIRVLKSRGEASVVPPLLEAAASAGEGAGEKEVAAAALETLESLGGREVDDEVLRQLDRADGRLRPILIEVAGRRRIARALPVLRRAADDPSEAIRAASFRALGPTATLEDLPLLISRYLSPRGAGEGPLAEEALRTAVKRIPEKDGSAEKILEAMASASAEGKIRLIEILRTVGGAKALQAVSAEARGPESPLRSAARKALGEWQSEDAAPAILALVAAEKGSEDRLDLLGRFQSVVSRLRFPKEQRLALCGRAMETARSDEERKIVLRTYAAIPAIETLPLLKPHLKNAALKEEASAAMVTIAERILRYDPPAMREPLKDALAATENPALAEKAKKLLEQAGGAKN